MMGEIGVLLGGIGALLVPLLTYRATVKRVGKPNGQGNVVQMNERILIEIGGVKATLDDHTTRLQKLEAAKVEVHTDPSGQHVTVSTPV